MQLQLQILIYQTSFCHAIRQVEFTTQEKVHAQITRSKVAQLGIV